MYRSLVNAYDALASAVKAGLLAGGMYLFPVALFALDNNHSMTDIAPVPQVERTASFTLGVGIPSESAADPVVEAPEPAAPNVDSNTVEAPPTVDETERIHVRISPSRRASSGAKVPSRNREGRERPLPRPDHRANTRTSASKSRKCEAGVDGVERLATNKYAIEKEIVDYYAKHLGEAQGLASVSWSSDESGEVIGFKVRRVKCGSLLYEAGLRSGDVIHEVNGRPITSYAQALSVYARLRNKSQIKLSITRKGQSKRMKYMLT